MRFTLESLEKRLQSLIEVHLLKYFPGYKVEDALVQQLIDAFKTSLTTQPFGNRFAANVYTLVASPVLTDQWETESQVIEEFSQIIRTVGAELGLSFAAPLTISIASDPELQPTDIRIVASYKISNVSETQGMPVEAQSAGSSSDNIPENAFLIIDGVKVFPLVEAVVNIGRRLDNHLVIDDPRVSRNHSQLRAIKGRFVLFDLDSTGGTYVNGERVNQTILYPGDVISLAGVPLIFGQDNPPPHPDTSSDTEPISPASSDRPTAVLDKPDTSNK